MKVYRKHCCDNLSLFHNPRKSTELKLHWNDTQQEKPPSSIPQCLNRRRGDELMFQSRRETRINVDVSGILRYHG